MNPANARNDGTRREDDRIVKFMATWWQVIVAGIFLIGAWYQSQFRIGRIEDNVAEIRQTQNVEMTKVTDHDKAIALIQQDMGYIKSGVRRLLERVPSADPDRGS